MAAAESGVTTHEFYLILMQFVEEQENLDVWERRMCPSVLISCVTLGQLLKVLALSFLICNVEIIPPL